MGTLLEAPELGQDTLIARDYQALAIENVRDAMKRGVRAVLVIHPTGTGKTTVVAKIARMAIEKGGNRTLVIAHRDELITQMANTLERVGIVPGIEKARARARDNFDPQVVVASVQTMNAKNLATWPRDFFRLVVVDEAHHCVGKSYQRILNHFARARVVGVTATPDRADGENLATIFGEVAHEMTIWEAMTAPHPGPYLCRLLYEQRDCGVDLRQLRPGKGDFTDADLEDRIRPHVETLANAIRQEAEDRPTIVFMPGVASATAMASALRSASGRHADWISGEDPDRVHKVARYQARGSQFLVNCGCLTEGFDAPHTAAIGLCRPTKSRALLSQMVGRGTRLGKPDCKLIDFDFLTDQHDLVRPADLFDIPDGSAEVRKMVEDTLAETGGLDILDVVETVAAKVKAETQRRREIEVHAKERAVSYRYAASFDPLDPSGEMAPKQGKLAIATHEPPTPKMVSFLRWNGHPNADAYSRRYAGKLIGLIKQRQSLDGQGRALGVG